MSRVDESKKRAENSWSKSGGPEGPWDSIVIGSGMGGMTAAAILAKAGQKVLVLEQHYVPGGFTHAFRRGPYHWDVGVHAIGEVTDKSMLGRLLAYLTGDRLEWASLGGVYDEFYYPGMRIDFPDNGEKFRANLIEAFPDEVDAIDDYLERVRVVGRAMKGYLKSRALPPNWWGKSLGKYMGRGAKMAFNQRVQEVLDEVTPNKKLQKVITGQWGYHGSPPSRAAFAVQALVSRHFVHGAYYPVGGAPEIARQLLRTVAEAGGWTRVRADVEQILIKKKKAYGVRLSSGEEIFAKQIISAAGVMSTIKRLLPDEAQGPWSDEISALTPAPAHVCLYVGFKGDIASAGAGPANKWFYDTWDLEAGTWNVEPGKAVPDAPVLYCSFPSLKDPSHDAGPEQHHTGEIVTFVPFETFAPWRDEKWRNRGEDYDAFKDAMKAKLLEQFFKRLPGMESMLDFAELGTPLSTDHFCRPMKGSIYGIEPTTERYACDHLRAHAPIKNLYFAGCEVGAVGVMGAMAGGMISAMAVEPRKAAGVLARANKRG